MSDLSALLGAMQSTGKSFEVAPCLVRETVARAVAACPSLASAAGVSVQVRDDYNWTVRGTAWPWDHRIMLRYNRRYGVTDSGIVGVTLHELAHIACYQEDLPFGDSDLEFGLKCKAAFAEWNALPDTIKTCETTWGAYQGQIGRENKRILARNRKV